MAFGVQALDAVASGAFVIRALECLTSLTAITFGLGYFDVVRNFCAVVETAHSPILIPLTRCVSHRCSCGACKYMKDVTP